MTQVFIVTVNCEEDTHVLTVHKTLKGAKAAIEAHHIDWYGDDIYEDVNEKFPELTWETDTIAKSDDFNYTITMKEVEK